MQRLLILILLSPLSLFSQNSYGHLAGGRSAGLAHATVALPNGFSTHHNQAGLALLRQKQVSASYQQRYLVNDLQLGHLGFSTPVANGHLGLAITQFGFEHFSETKIGLAYAQKLGKFISAGVQVNYEQNFVAEAQTFQTLTFETGLLAQVNEHLNLGFHVYNPTGSWLNENAELRLPTVARLGAAYTFSEEALWVAEVFMENQLSTRYSTGFEYRLLNFMALRAGLAIADDYEGTFGLSAYLEDFSLNVAYQYGFILGPNLSYGLQWAF